METIMFKHVQTIMGWTRMNWKWSGAPFFWDDLIFSQQIHDSPDREKRELYWTAMFYHPSLSMSSRFSLEPIFGELCNVSSKEWLIVFQTGWGLPVFILAFWTHVRSGNGSTQTLQVDIKVGQSPNNRFIAPFWWVLSGSREIGFWWVFPKHEA